jgi:DNA-directed RNA polymerase specialized sigma24 family protein
MNLVICDDKISKGRAVGSQNATRNYIMRVQLPGVDDKGKPRYRYVYPDDADHEGFDPEKGFKLKPGRTIAQVVNEKLFGHYGVDQRTGKPYKQSGLFYDYATKVGSAGKRKKWGDPVGEDQEGKHRFYKFKKLPGHVGIDYGPGVKEAGYRAPQKLRELELGPEEAKRAAKKLLGAGIREGNAPLTEEEFAGTSLVLTPDKAPVGTRSVLNTTELGESAKTYQAVHEPLPADIDPLKYVQAALEGDKLAPTKGVVKQWKPWMLEKFGGEEGLVAKLQQEPATTLMTLGRLDPKSSKTLSAIEKEWSPKIRGLVIKIMKHFGMGEAHDPVSRQYRKDAFQEFVSEASIYMLELPREYKATKDPEDHFSKWMYGALKNKIKVAVKEKMLNDKLTTDLTEADLTDNEDNPLVLEGLRAAGNQSPLSPEEGAELQRTTGVAQATIHRVINELPETYRRVLLSRLWLDKPASSERELSLIEQRKERGQASTEKWQRNLTGRDSVLGQYKTWTDPSTGKKVKLKDLSQYRAGAVLGKWDAEAKDALLRKLSVPITEAHVEFPIGAVKGKPVRVPNTEGEIQARLQQARDEGRDDKTAALILDQALGGEVRVPTPEGQMVQRWLELETRLARTNKRVWTDRYKPLVLEEQLHALTQPKPIQRDVVLAPKPARSKDGLVISAPKPVSQGGSAALRFFTSSENQRFASALGIRQSALDPSGTGGVYSSRNVSGLGTGAQTHADLAERHYKRVLAVQKHTPKELSSQLASAKTDIEHLKQAGVSFKEGSGITHAPSGDLPKYLEAVKSLHHAAAVIKQKTKLSKQAKKSSLASKGSVEIAKENPFKRSDRHAHHLVQRLLEVKPKTSAEVDRTILNWIDHRFEPDPSDKQAAKDWAKNRRETHKGFRGYLEKHGAIKTSTTRAAATAASHAPSEKDLAAYTEAEKHVHSTGLKLSKLHVGGKNVGADIVASYLTSKDLPLTHEQQLEKLRKIAQEAHVNHQILTFEKERREAVKSAGKTIKKSLDTVSLCDVLAGAIEAFSHLRSMVRRAS